MSLVGSVRLTNALENGSYDAASFETALGTQRTQDEYRNALSTPSLAERIGHSENAVLAILGSATSRVDLLETPDVLNAIGDYTNTAKVVAQNTTAAQALVALKRTDIFLKKPVWKNVTATGGTANAVYAHAFNTHNGNIFACDTTANILRSTDGMTTWTSIPTTGFTPYNFGFSGPTYTYAIATSLGGGYRYSTDSGATWLVPSPAFTPFTPYHVVFDRAINYWFILGAATNQIYYQYLSSISSGTWSSCSTFPSPSGNITRVKNIKHNDAYKSVACCTYASAYAISAATWALIGSSYMTQAMSGIASDNTTCIGVGGNLIFKLSDISATTTISTLYTAPTGVTFDDIEYFGNTFVASVSGDSLNTGIKFVVSSDAGLSWTPVYSSDGYTGVYAAKGLVNTGTKLFALKTNGSVQTGYQESNK